MAAEDYVYHLTNREQAREPRGHGVYRNRLLKKRAKKPGPL